MAAQFNVQAAIGTAETEGLGSEVGGALVEIRGHMEGWVELAECS